MLEQKLEEREFSQYVKSRYLFINMIVQQKMLKAIYP